jgi:CO/xanthine dehydrogenase Mo-binding subunit
VSGPEISRRKFLTGGALIVGFSMTATLSDIRRAFAATGGTGGPAGSVTNGWIVVKALTGGGTGTTITVYCPKVELGTGTQTALGQIVVEELYADMSMLDWVQGDTNLDPAADSNSQGYTAGSATVYVEGVCPCASRRPLPSKRCKTWR